DWERKTDENFRFLFPQSKIGNRKSKMGVGGAFGDRFRARAVRGCGRRAAGEEGFSDRLSLGDRPCFGVGPFGSDSAGAARLGLCRGTKYRHRVSLYR